MGYVKCVRVCTRIIHLMMKNMMAMKVSFREKVDKELDAEALRVIKLMPKWKPGYQGDSLVRVKYNLPVTFKMGEPSSLPTNNSKDN